MSMSARTTANTARTNASTARSNASTARSLGSARSQAGGVGPGCRAASRPTTGRSEH